MDLSALLGVFVALGAVLALLLAALRVLRRFAPASATGRGRLPMEVVQKLALGPKQSIAVVRVGDRVLAVGMGEGGLRPLAELDGADRETVLAGSTVPVPVASSAGALRGIAATAAGAAASHRELAALPGGRWLTDRLARRAAAGTSPTPAPAAAFAPPAAAALPTDDVAAAAPAAPAFRQALGIALSGATRLAAVLLAVGALAAPRGAAAQPASAPRAAAVRAVAAPALPSATQSALMQAAQQAAQRQAAAPAGRPAGRPAGPPAGPPAGAAPAGAAPLAGGTSTAAPPTPGVSPIAAPSADTMVARLAPTMDLRVGGQGQQGLRLSGTVGVVVMMGLMTLLPTLVLMMTGFTRILVVLHFLKQALGTQAAPPNQLVAGLALLLTGFVMAPTVGEVNRVALQPWLEGRIEQVEMMKRGSAPLREFMLRQTRERDIQTFVELSRPDTAPATVDEVPLVVVMSAFVTSELRTAFQLGFALFLPFIIIDVVVSSVLMSMGMFMLPPAMIALPFKLLLFVLVDGWTLVIQSLVQSFR